MLEAHVHGLLNANLSRTIYLLESYQKYQGYRDIHITPRTSRLILNVLADNMCNKPEFTVREKNLLDKCGGLICTGLFDILNEIKTLPYGAGQELYPVLYAKYLHPSGLAIKVTQIQERLEAMETKMSLPEITNALTIGERMAAALIFENRTLSAIILSHHYE